LDRFKHVNDTLGHFVGDKLLQRVALRLVACLRASDTACRYGGDEFVVLLPELSGRDGAAVVADNIRARLAAPYLIDGAEISISASLGIAMHPVDADGYGDLLRLSDLAMYHDKARCPAAPSIRKQRRLLGPTKAAPVSRPRDRFVARSKERAKTAGRCVT
jgi:diguanylate cyclase (GGDEF)-like protein